MNAPGRDGSGKREAGTEGSRDQPGAEVFGALPGQTDEGFWLVATPNSGKIGLKG